ncbi:hypothetical protein [Sphingobacterium sp.]|jgi:hypothetical protein|uniref:hypothetical protein n=1 Tax=Sphingobacterium sp. TaxID=341027 RepID=UPI0028A06B80|nr:hypothetical protein [Sphingobacterium sp.]
MDKEQEKFKRVMRMSKIELPFEDFEQRVMQRIVRVEKAKMGALSNKKCAIAFFLLGTICGMILNNYLLAKIQVIDIAADYKNYIGIFCQLVFAVLICFFCLQLWRLIAIQRYKSSH